MKQAMYIAEVQKVIGVNEVMDSMVATAERRLGPLANVQGGGGASAAALAKGGGELKEVKAKKAKRGSGKMVAGKIPWSVICFYTSKTKG